MNFALLLKVLILIQVVLDLHLAAIILSKIIKKHPHLYLDITCNAIVIL